MWLFVDIEQHTQNEVDGDKKWKEETWCKLTYYCICRKCVPKIKQALFLF